MKYALLSVLLLVMTGCVSVDYYGAYYPPTMEVEVFMNKADVTRSYKKIGTVTARTGEYASSEGALLGFREKAMAVGGHALILHQPKIETRGVRSVARGNSATKAKAELTRKGVREDSRTKTREVKETRVIKRKVLKADVIRYR